MKFIGFNREEEAEAWVRGKMDLPHEPGFFRAMSAVDKDGEFVCVVVLTNFTSRNIDINIAIDSAKMRPKGTIEMYNGVFGYLFDTLGVKRLTGLVGSDNDKSLSVVPKFGFLYEGTMRKALGNDKDLHIFGLLAEDYYQHNWYRA